MQREDLSFGLHAKTARISNGESGFNLFLTGELHASVEGDLPREASRRSPCQHGVECWAFWQRIKVLANTAGINIRADDRFAEGTLQRFRATGKVKAYGAQSTESGQESTQDADESLGG